MCTLLLNINKKIVKTLKYYFLDQQFSFDNILFYITKILYSNKYFNYNYKDIILDTDFYYISISVIYLIIFF